MRLSLVYLLSVSDERKYLCKLAENSGELLKDDKGFQLALEYGLCKI